MDFSHLDDRGNARMVDVSPKEPTEREAVAAGRIYLKPETIALIAQGGIPKGDVLAAARIAGIMAAKRTHELIPLCHNIPLNSARIELESVPGGGYIQITATVKCAWKTGVEMEALTAVSVAALTIYDMRKAADKEMEIGAIRLIRKTGGRSGDYQRSGDDHGQSAGG